MISHRSRPLFGHPPGLTVLFLTQTWAEFSFFGLQAMLVYYMTRQLQMPQATASLIYGFYGASAYFSPLLGGYLADKLLGRTWSVVIGALMMMCGHFALAFEPLLFPALALVALGNGLFIPPLAVQVGGLYADDDSRRSQAFSLYYMGTNLGAMLAPVVCGTLGEKLGWHWGFAAAGFGMLTGLVIYWSFRAHLPEDPTLRERTRLERAPLSASDWANLRALFFIGASVVLFRIGYEQSGNIIALWIADQTDRVVEVWGHPFEIPATWFQSINPLLIIVLTPFLVQYWNRRAIRLGAPDLRRRMALGCAIAAAAAVLMVAAAWAYSANGHAVSPWWVIGYFAVLTVGELHVLPVGLSLFGTLAPMQIAAIVMGAWYIAKFLGSLIAGIMGTLWQEIPPEAFFGIGALAPLLAAIMLSTKLPAQHVPLPEVHAENQSRQGNE